jgi:integrase
MNLDRVDTRQRLKPRRDPYWQRLAEGRYLGFRRMATGASGTWLARFYDGERYLYRPLGEFPGAEKERFDAARVAADEWFSHLNIGGDKDPGTVAEACKRYVQHLRLEKGDAAADDAEGFYKRLVIGNPDVKPPAPADPIAKVDLSKATKAQFSAWRARVRQTSNSDSSFNRNLTPLRAALNHALATGKVPTNQAWREALKPIKGDVGERRELYLDPRERDRLIERASDDGRLFLNTLRLVPLRPGDVANLKVEHFDRRHGKLSIPKGKTKRHDILLSAVAAAHFKQCAKDKLPGAWLVSRANGQQWKKAAWRDIVKEAAVAAKLPQATVAYTLRHSVITDLVVETDLDLFTIAQISGTSVAMIEKHYGKLRQHRARAALDALAKM